MAQPGIDPARVAYVGHDCGMMYGLRLSKTDKRPCVWALQAGTDAFQEWYLLGRKNIPEAEKEAVRKRLQPLAPIRFIGALSAAVFLQFGSSDFFVSKARVEALATAASSP